jgi:tRNA modification GTPase
MKLCISEIIDRFHRRREGSMQEETIAGIASGMGGGISIIRISGENALQVVGSIFRTKKYLSNLQKEEKENIIWKSDYFEKKETHTVHYGFIVNDQEEILDEVIVVLMKGPNSYTKEDVVEIDTHGGNYVVKKILNELLHHGARLAEPGEFTKRAFLNGRIDLSQAEAVMKLISSQNDFSYQSALNQLEGEVSQYIEKIRQDILHQLGYIEAALDDPEHISLDGFAEQLREIMIGHIQKLNKLLLNFDDGRMKSEGINTVIVGKPNAGKSSLMNLMLQQERAIVTNIAGTTRDVLEEKVVLGNIILNLIDTAGIHETEDIVENMGVDKAVDYIEKADFIIYVMDASDKLNEADEQIIQLLQDKKGIILFNKSDLNLVLNEKEINSRLNWTIIPFSNETKQGLEQLKEYITNSFLKGDIQYNDQVYITSVRHKNAVESAVQSLEQVVQTIDDGMPEDFYTIDMMEAYQSLGLINGETASEDLVNKIFSDFCMGK